ncbi:MAG TPA: aminopeptidase [Candidatus Dormibacteraeota bacterium]|nr:aminopeptidase [Candidatus Dormibacteraeota bacterium]
MLSEYATGARNAVRACLNVHPGDRVAIVGDRGRADIAAAMAEESLAAGGEVAGWTMEDWVRRPATELPRGLADELVAFRPTVSFFIGEGEPGELGFRKPLLELLARELRCRHGHMIGIDRALMLDGMAVDYDEVYQVTRRIHDIVRHASRIEVATRLGTEMTATFSPGRRWVPCDGRYWEQGLWGNLPEGEVFTAPVSVDGLLVGEELGDHFARRYGLLDEPVRMRLQAGRVAAVEMHRHPAVRAEIEAYLAQSPDSNRAGEFAIGTNVGLSTIVGNFLQDEKFPGVHVAFGDPYGAETGADWACPSHVDVLASRADVWVDGRRVMENGRFLDAG